MKTKICIFAILLTAGLINGHAQDTWTQKADFGGTPRYGAVGFSIGSKGYMGTGYDFNVVHYKDFWEYDSSTNTWTQKADLAESSGWSRQFYHRNKGYVGTGSALLRRL